MSTTALASLAAQFLPSSASASFTLGIDNARHLLNRTGYGCTLNEARTFAQLGSDEAIELLLSAAEAQIELELPSWANERVLSLYEQNQLDSDSRRSRRQLFVMRKEELQIWQTRKILETDSPLREKMVMFWHRLFYAPIVDVPEPVQYCQYIRIIREHAFGDYREMLRALMQNPAFIQAHNGHRNMRLRSDERFTTTLLEHMTLGPGVADRRDLRGMQKTLTGLSLDKDDGSYVFNPEQHIDGDKTVFEQTAPFEPVDAPDLILQHPQNARWVVKCMWQEFASEDIEDDVLDELSNDFRRHHNNLQLLQSILLHPNFWKNDRRGALVKSPLDLIISTSRLFDQYLLSAEETFEVSKRLGLEIFHQDPGFTNFGWVNPTTLPLRLRLLRRMSRGTEQMDTALYDWAQDQDLLEQITLPIPPQRPVSAASVQGQIAAHLLDLGFQLK